METGILIGGILLLVVVFAAIVVAAIRRGSTKGRITVEWSKEEGPTGSNLGPTFRPKAPQHPDGPGPTPTPPDQVLPDETPDPDHPDGPS
jgi:hypothetical protein